MKKWLLKLLPFLLGVVVGAGGLFGFQYVYGADAQSIMQHLQGDSARVAAADSAAKPALATADSLPSVAVDTTVAPLIDPLTLQPADTGAAASPAAMGAFPGDPGGDPLVGEDRLPRRRLAKMFGSMQAREAARVLEKMSDTEVEIILSQLGDREAATILSNLTPERAAQISQVVIRGERSAR